MVSAAVQYRQCGATCSNAVPGRWRTVGPGPLVFKSVRGIPPVGPGFGGTVLARVDVEPEKKSPKQKGLNFFMAESGCGTCFGWAQNASRIQKRRLFDVY